MSIIFLILSVFVVIMGTVSQASQPEYCRLPLLQGPCRATIIRYYFDVKSQDCRVFTYGGCSGNANNFQTMTECRAACVCNLNYTSALSCFPPYFRSVYNYTQATCLSAVNGACAAPKKSFLNYYDCLDTCTAAPCFLPPAQGPCRAASTQYFYNSTSRACEKFNYGGCDGNANRFITLDDCNRQCVKRITATTRRSRVCAQPADRGSCTASVPRFFYNSQSQACELFTFSGCGGNENNFDREEDCRLFCTLSDRSEDFEFPVEPTSIPSRKD